MKKVLVRSSGIIKKQILYCLILSLLASNLYADWTWQIYDVDIWPAHPTPTDRFDIDLSGEWGSSCVPIGSDVSVAGNDIFIEVYFVDPSTLCATVMTSWHQSVEVGPLATDTYNIYVNDDEGPGHIWIGNVNVSFPVVVTLLSPDGGETLQAGDAHSVTWSSSGSISNVKLEYSTNNGAGWTVITASTANDGQYDWTVPEVTSSQCLVRVSDASDAGVNDESDGVFNIYVCEISTSADTDGDCEVGTADLLAVGADWLRNGNPFEAGFTEAPAGMVFIANGEYDMGDHAGGGDADELPLHTVYIDAFYINKNETTNQQYCDYLNAAKSGSEIKVASGIVYAIGDDSNSLPYLSTTSASTGPPNYSEYSQIAYSGGTFNVITRDSQSMADHPVVNVSWDGAKAYCDHYGLRLPTEAEWEYAARGGAYYYKYPWGTDVINQSLANYKDGGFANPLGLTAMPYTSNAGYYGPQGGYGLCDMAGNVYEWCSDWYDSGYYSVSATNNPTGPASGTMHIFRSGTWGFEGTQCRVSYRGASIDIWGNTLGFRVVMDLD